MRTAHIIPLRLALTGLIALGWIGACSDQGPEVPVPPPQGVVVSNPAAPLTTSARLSAWASVTAGEEDVAYASLMPETVPQGAIASVRAIHSGSLVWTTVINGGFDPVAVTGQFGDTIEVVVRDAAGADVFVARAALTTIRAPVIVRTFPPTRKRDVPLNAAIVLVFSEPVDAATLTAASVQVFRGPLPIAVAGTVRLLPGSGTAAAFTPTVPLARTSDYRLVVTRAVRDLDGDVLVAGTTVTFTTGQSLAGPPASIELSPDTVHMTGPTYQMTATVRDAAGNELIDQPITWSTSDPTGLAVSATGLLTGLAKGFSYVTAALNELTASTGVFVTAVGGPPDSVAVSPAQTIVGAAGDTIILAAIVRDASGRLVDPPSVTWTSSAPAVATVAASGYGTSGVAFGTVTGVTPGSVTITATSGAANGTASVTVVPPLPVASLTVTPDPAAVLLRGTLQLSAAIRDATGKVLAGRLLTWTSDNPAVATVDASGVVTGVSLGSAAVTATSEGVSGTASITVQSPVLAFVSTGEGTSEIYAVNADGSAQANLTNNAASDRFPAWSPDGQKIAFWSDRDGYGHIYVMNADGTGLTRLTNDAVSGDHPLAWSPDGRRIAFVSWYDGYDIYVMNADGSALTRLTDNPANDQSWEDHSPAWSPDGQKIVFWSDRDRNGEIYVMNADGSDQTNLTNSAAWDYFPAWSPDGQKIAFVSFRDGNGEIYVMNADGSAATKLTNNAGLSASSEDNSPRWSPDGRRIAFGNGEIYAMDADGGALTNLTNHASRDRDPTWSPDGQKIAFASYRDGTDEIYVMNADGRALTRLTHTSNAPYGFSFSPRWRP